MGRTAGGVRGMSISEADEIVGVAIVDNEQEEILVIKISTITKDGQGPDVVNDEIAATIEAVITELLGNAAVVELEKA